MVESRQSWLKLNIDMLAEDLARLGPNVNVKIRAADQTDAWHEALALIDTGTTQSGISHKLAHILGAAPVDDMVLHTTRAEPVQVPVFSCTVHFMDGADFTKSFCRLPRLNPPYDLIIGLDILTGCRLGIDFSTGHWQLHFPAE